MLLESKPLHLRRNAKESNLLKKRILPLGFEPARSAWLQDSRLQMTLLGTVPLIFDGISVESKQNEHIMCLTRARGLDFGKAPGSPLTVLKEACALNLNIIGCELIGKARCFLKGSLAALNTKQT